jgi:stage II sporulation protein D
MKARWCLPLLLAACAACSSPDPRIALPAASRRDAPHVVAVLVREHGQPSIRHVPLEEYVHGSIVAEFAPAAAGLHLAERMYEVQAVISRTYAVTNPARHTREGYDLCATTHCQLYDPSRRRTSRWARAAADAVQRTSGLVVWYDAAPARAVFHADCGGHTSAAAAVWGGRDRPYLAAVPDDGPAEAAHSAWRYEAAHAAVLAAMNADPRTRVGDRLDTIEVLDRDRAGRAERIALHGRREAIVRGDDLRDVLTRAFGPRAVRSTRFTVRRDGPLFTFEGVGFGHGVGLCQAGALARLGAGATPTAVLQWYFPGTTLRTVQ